MFGSKRRAPPQPLTKETANPNAATAAAAVFSHNRAPSQNLSSAAAAAALKTRPITPTNVSDVQTRRTHRRTPSLSSIGSRESRSRREVQRSPSVGSMTDRTFRSPSPGRSPAPAPQAVPPVPQIPADAGQMGQRAPAGLQTQSFKTASQRQKEGRGSWFGGATPGDFSNVRSSDAVLQRTYSPISERPLSPSSINFSYPRAQTESPAPRQRPMSASGSLPDQSMVYDANSRRMVPRYQLLSVQQMVQDASQKPPKVKKSNVSRSGSHLSHGTVARTKTAAPQVHSITEEAKDTDPDDSLTTSISRELTLVEPEPEAERDKPIQSIESDPQTMRTSSSSSPSQEQMAAEAPEILEDEKEEGRAKSAPAQTEGRLLTTSTLDGQGRKAETNSHSEATLLPKQVALVEKTRVPSESPARSARFAPSTPEQLQTRHSPPPRSLSPLKSAMKSSTRDPSPSASNSETSPSHADLGFEETPTPRRKSRVQFDDSSNTVVEDTTPVVDQTPSSALSKKPWSSMMSRLGKKEHAPVDEEETMGPRPTLPLFGSIRQKKVAEPEERPLVRPLERAQSPPSRSSPAEDSPEPSVVGQSNDAAIGSILAKENGMNKNAANISKAREPLPPVVTSLEEPAYSSPSDDESDDEIQAVRRDEPARVEEVLPKPEAAVEQLDLPSTGVPSDRTASESVPAIFLQEPSPLAKPATREPNLASSKEYFDIPGGFPEEGDSTPTQDSFDKSKVPFLADEEPESVPTRPLRKNSMDASDQMTDITEESEADSIYSDAYEDLSETEGDGFLSLDAIVDSSTAAKSPPRSRDVHASSAGSETKAKEKLYPQPKDETGNKTETVANASPPDDWETAKAYWKSLSLLKRKQLEEEAMEEAGNEAETESPPIKSKRDSSKPAAEPVSENSTPTRAVSAAPPPVPPIPTKRKDDGYQIQPGTKWSAERFQELSQKSTTAPKTRPKSMSNPTMRKSMRGSASPEPPSPRARANSGDDGSKAASGFRKSMRSTGPARDNKNPRGRPMSYAAPSSSEPAREPPRNRSADGASKTSRFGLKSSLRRRGSDSSESSFTRARPGSSAAGGIRSSMRGSMRESPAPAHNGPYSSADATAKSTSRFSLRSLSPSPFHRNSVSLSQPQQTQQGAGRIRTSMRENANAGKKKKLGFGKPSKEKSAKQASRFGADSSDEEGEPSRGFHSRFIDSSDDEKPSPAPKSKGQRSFTTMRTSKASAVDTGGRSTVAAEYPANDGSGRDVASPPAPGTLDTSRVGNRPSHSRTGSFMSNILRRKKDDSNKISRSINESAARRDTPLERSTGELALMRSNSSQRLKVERESSWPLPDSNANANAKVEFEANPAPQLLQRPSTAGGPLSLPKGNAVKKGYLRRRSASHQGVPSQVAQQDFDDNESTATEPSKKKKFSGLRKMLRIKD